MGLFSFLKNVGSNVFGKENKVESTDNSAEANSKRIASLENIIQSNALKVDNLSIEFEGDKVIVYGQTESQSEKEKVILALGNVEGVATVDDRISVTVPEPEARFYEVKSGDSLSKIAKEFYGDAMKYPQIFEANKPMLKDPNNIYPGQVLRIPTS